jgi:excinuclease ABC subunit A
VLHRLVDKGNTVIVIEHDLDVVKTADHVIDLGPEGGSGGGRIVVTGTPEDVAAMPTSHTGLHLRPLLPDVPPAARRTAKRPPAKRSTRAKTAATG